MTMSEKACTEITNLKHNEFLKKSGRLPTSSLPLISRTRSVCLAASAMDMSSSTLLSAGCTKKLFSCSQTILSSQKPPECAHQELDIAVAPGCTMQNPMSRRQDTKLRHLVTNNSGGQQCSSWSNNHKQKQTAPTQGHFSFSQAIINFPVSSRKIIFQDITSRAFNHCHAGGDCEMQATKPKSQALLQQGHTHTPHISLASGSCLEKQNFLYFQVQGREPLGGNYWLQFPLKLSFTCGLGLVLNVL